MVKIYCEVCQRNVELKIDMMESDTLNGDKIWGDLVCAECCLIIASLEVDAPGIYEFVKMKDLPDNKQN